MNVRFASEHGCEMVSIGIGETYVSKSGQAISTLLGTCVAVTLYDRLRGIGGLNHFMLAGGETGRDSQTGRNGETGRDRRYGVHAMAGLLKEMERAGADTRNLEAKVFGGSWRSATEASMDGRIARDNSDLAVSFLQSACIPVVAHEVGGTTARRLIFLTATGQVLVRKIPWTTVKAVEHVT